MEPFNDDSTALKEPEKSAKVLILPALLLTAVLALLGLVVYLSRAAPAPTPLEAEADRERAAQDESDNQLAVDEALLIDNAKAAVLKTLRDPESARFGRVFVRYCKGLDCKAGDPAHGAPMVCGGVNAKNGFGGYTGLKVFLYGNGTLIPPDATEEQLPLVAKVCLD